MSQTPQTLQKRLVFPIARAACDLITDSPISEYCLLIVKNTEKKYRALILLKGVSSTKSHWKVDSYRHISLPDPDQENSFWEIHRQDTDRQQITPLICCYPSLTARLPRLHKLLLKPEILLKVFPLQSHCFHTMPFSRSTQVPSSHAASVFSLRPAAVRWKCPEK